jgi:hypothetical protein
MSPKTTDVEIVERTIAQLNDKCDRTASRTGPQLYWYSGQVLQAARCRDKSASVADMKQPRQPVERDRKPTQAAAQFRR